MDYLLPPEEFIKVVLDMYYQRGWTVQEIAEKFEVGTGVINRILDQYGKDQLRPCKQNLIEDKSKKKKEKLEVDEMKDVARKALDKITDEDIKDLRIDLHQFEKGKESDETN